MDPLPPWAHPAGLALLLPELFRRQGYRTLEAIETPDRTLDLVLLRDTLFEHDLRLVRCYWVAPGHSLGRMPLEAFAEGMRRISEVGGIFIALGPVPEGMRVLARRLGIEVWDLEGLAMLLGAFQVPLDAASPPPAPLPPEPAPEADLGLGAPPTTTQPPFLGRRPKPPEWGT
ncbi:MAG TPA: restriction endonuclease [bacterium]|nr:restriction endonuclease [bacterium]